jgi:hypothetical protein
VTAPDPAATALAAAGELGAFFRIEPTVCPDRVSWARLYTDPGVLDRRLAEVRATQSSGPVPVDVPGPSGRVYHPPGLAARLVAPALGAGLLAGLLLVAENDGVHLRPSGATNEPRP